MQRWVLVRAGVVRDYLFSVSAPNDIQKRNALFGSDEDSERSLIDEGTWHLVSTSQLVTTDWTFNAGVYTAPAPAPSPRVISAQNFLNRFSSAEQAALYAADPRLIAGAIKVATQGNANLDSAEAAQLIGLAVSKNALTQARAAEILA